MRNARRQANGDRALGPDGIQKAPRIAVGKAGTQRRVASDFGAPGSDHRGPGMRGGLMFRQLLKLYENDSVAERATSRRMGSEVPIAPVIASSS